MHETAEQRVANGGFLANHHRSRGLVSLLVILAVSPVPFLAYHQVRHVAEQRQAALAITGGEPDRAPMLVTRYGCGGCHSIPGIAGATGQVGPDLGGLARRVFVGGATVNMPDQLVNFIVDPKSLDPESAMPRTGISATEARDIAAYLYGLTG